MALTPSSPVTGGAQTGFTSPTYTLVIDSKPDNFSNQWYVSAIGGTQAGVNIHTATAPFTLKISRPQSIRKLPAFGVGQVVTNVPRNKYTVEVRHAALPAAGQPTQDVQAMATLSIPAGSETADIANVRAAISLLVGTLSQLSAELGNTAQSGAI